MRLWHRLKSRTGPWTLDSTLYMKNVKGRGEGQVGVRGLR